MAKQLKRLWKFFNTDVGELFSTETLTGSADAAKDVLELAKTLKEQSPNIEQLAPLVGNISTLLDVLNSPIAQIVGSGLPFIGIATGLLKFYLEKSKQDLTLPVCAAIVTQAAYLESLKSLLALPENQAMLMQIGENPVSDAVKKQIKKLGELELDDAEAKKAVVCFHDSKLATAFNEVLSARLQQAGLDVSTAEILTERVARNTHRYINEAVAAAGEKVKPLAELFRNGGRELLEKYLSIDSYLEDQIAAKPHESIFAESFTFQDIYVPLKAKPVDKNGDVNQREEAFSLETWAKDILNHPQKQAQVMFIQGGPGRGKSVFCRMFADLVRQDLHPIWTPILIRLRDISTLQKSFRETLREAVIADFAASDDGWLTDRNTRFLFFLDGFDELVMEGRTSGGLEEFLKQVGQFQTSCQQSKDLGHRVLITGRSLALHSVERLMPPNLERVEIQPMDDELQRQWFVKWSAQVGTDKTLAFQQFLQDKCCPERVRELAREPLLLYMLAAMHRDGKLTVEMFEGASGVGAKILIYQTSLKWVLEEQRPAWLNRQLTAMETEGLQRILAEAALCVAQSGGECAAMDMVKERIKDNDAAAGLIRDAQKQLGDDALKNALAAFYLQPAAGDKGGSVEFAHKSFSEFLFAQKLKECLEEWTEPGRKGEDFLVKNSQMAWEIYDLLGYGGLTQEIVEYLTALLTDSGEFRPVQLFKRLENFYVRWCDGEFMDALQDNYPQKKMSQLQGQKIKTGVRQVDVYAGLNVMILLLKLHRYAQSRDDLKDQIAFYPCGRKDTEDFDELRLLRIIGYSHCVSVAAFLETVGQFLSGAFLSGADLRIADLRIADLSGANLSDANLSGANLSDANLSRADLSDANLSRADLRGANLSDANLSDANLSRADLRIADLSDANLSRANLRGAYLRGADLSGAYLSRADLSDANLSRADLRGADLSDAYLSRANLSDANLSDANLSGAYLENISWDDKTNWDGVTGLETAIKVPEALKQQLGLK